MGEASTSASGPGKQHQGLEESSQCQSTAELRWAEQMRRNSSMRAAPDATQQTKTSSRASLRPCQTLTGPKFQAIPSSCSLSSTQAFPTIASLGWWLGHALGLFHLQGAAHQKVVHPPPECPLSSLPFPSGPSLQSGTKHSFWEPTTVASTP